MPRFARLFDAAENTLEAWRDALKQGNWEEAMKLWMDEESVSCVLPNGQRVHGHEALREVYRGLLEARPILIDPLETNRYETMGVAIFEVVEALRFTVENAEADLYVNTTYILMQNHAGWRFSHIHCSPALESEVLTLNQTKSRTHALH